MKKIIHVDMDAFFASVEIRDNPSLRGKPVIVGGMPGTRGVVCTCSYAARKYGVHSVMSANRAYELCPNGIFLKPRFEAYLAVSKQIRAIFHDYTDIVEPLSLDEAYLDVTTNKKDIPYAVRIAKEIRARIRKETDGLTGSAGVSYNMFLAKMASDCKKPDGLTVILPEYALRFLDTLPIGSFYGIGKVTEREFRNMGVNDGAALRQLSREFLTEKFGRTGSFYYDIARGIDLREVTPDWQRKSLGTEITFDADTLDLTVLYEMLQKQCREVSEDLKKQNLCGKTVTLKLKFFDFRTITRSRTCDRFLDGAGEILSVAKELLFATDAGKVAVRLIGVTVSNFFMTEQMTTPDDGAELWQPELNLYGDSSVAYPSDDRQF